MSDTKWVTSSSPSGHQQRAEQHVDTIASTSSTHAGSHPPSFPPHHQLPPECRHLPCPNPSANGMRGARTPLVGVAAAAAAAMAAPHAAPPGRVRIGGPLPVVPPSITVGSGAPQPTFTPRAVPSLSFSASSPHPTVGVRIGGPSAPITVPTVNPASSLQIRVGVAAPHAAVAAPPRASTPVDRTPNSPFVGVRIGAPMMTRPAPSPCHQSSTVSLGALSLPRHPHQSVPVANACAATNGAVPLPTSSSQANQSTATPSATPVAPTPSPANTVAAAIEDQVWFSIPHDLVLGGGESPVDKEPLPVETLTPAITRYYWPIDEFSAVRALHRGFPPRRPTQAANATLNQRSDSRQVPSGQPHAIDDTRHSSSTPASGTEHDGAPWWASLTGGSAEAREERPRRLPPLRRGNWVRADVTKTPPQSPPRPSEDAPATMPEQNTTKEDTSHTVAADTAESSQPASPPWPSTPSMHGTSSSTSAMALADAAALDATPPCPELQGELQREEQCVQATLHDERCRTAAEKRRLQQRRAMLLQRQAVKCARAAAAASVAEKEKADVAVRPQHNEDDQKSRDSQNTARTSADARATKTSPAQSFDLAISHGLKPSSASEQDLWDASPDLVPAANRKARRADAVNERRREKRRRDITSRTFEYTNIVTGETRCSGSAPLAFASDDEDREDVGRFERPMVRGRLVNDVSASDCVGASPLRSTQQDEEAFQVGAKRLSDGPNSTLKKTIADSKGSILVISKAGVRCTVEEIEDHHSNSEPTSPTQDEDRAHVVGPATLFAQEKISTFATHDVTSK